METYILETHHPDMNSEGGVKRRRWLSRATGPIAAGADLPGTAVTIIDQGAHLNEQAEAHGILDGGAVEL
ncbi:hypothetical protein [Pseudosulfitobacter pseudonitzschiae]|uniref:hypothetical protein n=1 Tax=Pseudosulfitobacter pseudonitzschiae TaxID=1402135 RepID=UPI001AF3C1EA|nr:hypothetical protein [Pseudosulfitobacter pseudonitzschiae]MBM1815965.1 hypothetical protein [Pseudosulfitobacter pseudonitzschiae]MBM1833271.1 hypothetical protein [Pseudosulfitobacter pseudonitzschiae]MBM1842670.1 hypothetical protein [Pseudosulfitobacter pseudonitzschiae]MBM1852694.1 hypothetical protein [Pseudosulfitobacter pseudonitzschiae]MBM1857218.1 hypothetical protein [Pseudosulfitobacter pseudonitzschiae]